MTLSLDEVLALEKRTVALSEEDTVKLIETVKFLFQERDRLNSIIREGVAAELEKLKSQLFGHISTIYPQMEIVQKQMQK